MFTLLVVIYFYLETNLENIKVIEENLVGEYVSPDSKYTIEVYFHGGILFRTDVSYVGVLIDNSTQEAKNIFLVAGKLQKVNWVDNSNIEFQNINLPITDTYDFRK